MRIIGLVLLLTTSCWGFLVDPAISGSAVSYWERSLNTEAQRLVNRLADPHDCTSIYEAAHNLTLKITDDRMAYKAVHELAGLYKTNFLPVPDGCSCTGTPKFWLSETLPGDANCRDRDANYKRMYNHFFGDGENTKLGCNTHRSIWHGLVTLTNHHSYRPFLCQWTLINEISNAFAKYGSECKCVRGTVTTKPTTSTTTTTTTTSTTARTTRTTTTLPTTTIIYPEKICDKFQVIEAVGKRIVLFSTGSIPCSNSNYSSSDALVMKACSTGPASSWTKGNNVMARCQTNTIQPYTAIASFPPNQNTFQNVGHIAAVFIKCESVGFEIAFQDCEQEPILKHLIIGGFGQLDPHSYYTIAS